METNVKKTDKSLLKRNIYISVNGAGCCHLLHRGIIEVQKQRWENTQASVFSKWGKSRQVG